MILSRLTSPIVAACVLAAISVRFGTWSAAAQPFNSGSNGSLGDINVPGSNATTFLTDDGRLHYETVTVAAGGTWRFRANDFNTPVDILAHGDIVIDRGMGLAGVLRRRHKSAFRPESAWGLSAEHPREFRAKR